MVNGWILSLTGRNYFFICCSVSQLLEQYGTCVSIYSESSGTDASFGASPHMVILLTVELFCGVIL